MKHFARCLIKPNNTRMPWPLRNGTVLDTIRGCYAGAMYEVPFQALLCSLLPRLHFERCIDSSGQCLLLLAHRCAAYRNVPGFTIPQTSVHQAASNWICSDILWARRPILQSKCNCISNDFGGEFSCRQCCRTAWLAWLLPNAAICVGVGKVMKLI